MTRKIVTMAPAQNWYAKFENTKSITYYPVLFWATYTETEGLVSTMDPLPVGGVVWFDAAYFADEQENFCDFIYSPDAVPEEEDY